MFKSPDISLRTSVVRGFAKAGEQNIGLNHRNKKDGENVKRGLDQTNTEDFSK